MKCPWKRGKWNAKKIARKIENEVFSLYMQDHELVITFDL